MSGNGLNSQYYTSSELEDYFVSNNNGAALSYGTVWFYEDTSRTTPKNVFELIQGSNNPPNYTYAPLPNPLTLSAVGTFVDANNNNIAVYYYPYDVYGNVQLYYIAVYDQYGNLQFTREAWPYPANITSGGTTAGATALYNQITNGQFTQVLFNQPLITGAPSVTIPYSSPGASVVIAPGWTLKIGASGSGVCVVSQIPVTGVSALPNNPPFTLNITAGANTTSMSLTQQLNNNPDWAAPMTADVAGYLSASIMLNTGVGPVSVSYSASNGNTALQPIISNATNGTGSPNTYYGTVQLLPADSGQTGLTGYDLITITLPITGTSSISNVQIIPLTTNVSNVAYDPVPSNRQMDYMFHYYNPLLQQKPIPSYLVGWDFPLNPAQFLGASVAAQAVGANSSYYAWDQTILFQTTTSGITVSRDGTGALKTLSAAVAGTQIALIQYIPAPQAIEMLSRRKCVNVSANASVATTATASLWYTKGALPSTVGSNVSIISNAGGVNIDANGYPTVLSAGWIQVPRSGLGYSTTTTTATNAAQFTIGVAPTGAASFNQYPLAGWDMQGNTDIDGATFFAIVVGTASLAHNAYVLWQSISCQDGDIPTVPAPLSVDETLRKCQYYYCSSFNPGVVPASQLGGTAGISIGYEIITPSGGAGLTIQVQYPTKMYTAPTTITTYNPISAGAQMYDFSNTGNCTGTNVTGTIGGNNVNNQYGFFASAVGPTPSSGAIIGFGWTADGRLGQ